jgi:hypothetical protein
MFALWCTPCDLVTLINARDGLFPREKNVESSPLQRASSVQNVDFSGKLGDLRIVYPLEINSFKPLIPYFIF